MKIILTLAARELRSSFVTPVAYVILAGFLFIAGFFFFSLVQQFNNLIAQAAMMPDAVPSLNEWVIQPYYQTLEIILVFLVPLVTMRVISEERRTGTFELLITSPQKVGNLILGKFLGVSLIVSLMLLLSLVFPLVLIVFSNPEVPPILVGFLGLLFFSWALTAIGIAISASTRSQTIAGVISLVVFLLFYLADAPVDHVGDKVAAVLQYLTPTSHSLPFFEGVIDAKHVVYFASVTALGIYIANRILDAEQWR